MHADLSLLLRLLATSGALALSACGDDGSPARPDAAGASEPLASDAGSAPTQECERGALESDLQAAPLAGPGLVNGALPPGRYVFSTTYLRLRPEPAAQQRFGALMEPIMADLMARPGLLAVALGVSAQCGTARTFTVWQDEVAMLDFVTGEAHGAAVAAVGEVSRGGSLVTHWLGEEDDADWSVAARRAAADEGPFY